MPAMFVDRSPGFMRHAPTLRLLGDFAVDPPALAPHGRKARALLARLVLADGPLARDRLSALLWSHRADSQAHASLRQCLVELKSWTRASPPLVRADRDTVAIDHGHVADDISLLRTACMAGDPDAALRWLPGEDIGLLADLDGVDEAWDDWLAVERARQGDSIVRDVLAMADRLLDAGDLDAALAVADRITRFDPCSEHAARLVMRARWQAGDSDGVRHAWQRIEDALGRGLDGTPSPESRALYRDLMAKRPTPTAFGVAGARSPATAKRMQKPAVRRIAALAVIVATLGLAGADAPRGGSSAAVPVTSVVRIEPIVSHGNGAPESRFADALAGDFARLAGAFGGGVRVLDGKTAGDEDDFIVRVSIERDGDALVSESRVVDALSGSILWSNRLSGAAGDVARLRERTAVSVAGIVDCALTLNGPDRKLAADADRRTLVFAICDADSRNSGARAGELLDQMAQRWPRDAAVLGQSALFRAKHIWEARDPVAQERQRQQAIRAARRALAVDPDNAPALVALSLTGRGELYMVDALPTLERALVLDPDLPAALMTNATGLFQAGFVNASVDPAMRAERADPTSIFKALAVVRRLAAAGRLREASGRLAEIEAIWPSHPELAEHRQRLAVEMGRREAAAIYAGASAEERQELQMLLLRQVADPGREAPEIAAVAEAEVKEAPPVAYQLAAHYARVGDMPKALAWLDRAPVRATDGQWSLLYWPSVAPLRREPRFFAKMARLGLVDYWRRHDRWPDFCHEPGLRYDCRTETVRLARAGRAISGGNAASR